MRGVWAIIVILISTIALTLVFRLTRNTLIDSGAWVAMSTRADSLLGKKADTVWVERSYRKYGASNEGHRSFKPLNIELNRADSATLRKVYGIGAVFSGRIIKRRTELGGFHSLDQLLEIKGITGEVFSTISPNFWVNGGVIQKISINFAPVNVLTAHPYCSPSMARRIERERMKGGFFRSTEDLIDRDILLPQEAQRFAPYLSFVNN